MQRSIAGALIATVLVLMAVASGSAQSDPGNAGNAGFALNHFEPSERGSEWFVLESLDLRGHLRPSLGVVGDLAYRPLVVASSEGDLRRSIVRNQYHLHVGAGLVLWDRLRVSLSVPVLIYTDGFDFRVDDATLHKPASAAGVGDVRLGADLRVFGVYGDAITAAVGAQVALPTGDRDVYLGDGKVRVMPRVLIAGDIAAFVYAVKLGAELRAARVTFVDGQVGTNLFFAVSAGVRLADKKLVIGPEVFGRSVVVKQAFFDRASTPLEAALGAHYTFLDDWRVGLGVASWLTAGYGSPLLRGLASIEWVPAFERGPEDRDHDSIPDASDACPTVAGIASSDPSANGCPPDRDRDHVLDVDDACPDTTGVATQDPSTNGCPPDRDRDGVIDAQDACPDVAGVATNEDKTNGCPPDRDHDGVIDAQDACPDTPGLKTGDPRTHGCPDPDRDRDTISNEDDACPDAAGPDSPDRKRRGCPQAFVSEGQIKILDQVKFKTASAEILPGKDSEIVLLAVLEVLQSHPEIKKLRVEGHTDNRGKADMNMKLSAARAASVVKWLTGHGIEASRLTSEGFGLTRPIDSNDTDEGRHNNRRVEFHLVE